MITLNGLEPARRHAGPFATEARLLDAVDRALAGSDPCEKLQAAARLVHHGLAAEAVEAFQTIAERHPERRCTCLERIGDVLCSLHRFEAAAESFREALAAAPSADHPRLEGKAVRALRQPMPGVGN